MNKLLKPRFGVSLVAVAMLMFVFVSLRAQQPPAAQPPRRGPAINPADIPALSAQLRKANPGITDEQIYDAIMGGDQ